MKRWILIAALLLASPWAMARTNDVSDDYPVASTCPKGKPVLRAVDADTETTAPRAAPAKPRQAPPAAPARTSSQRWKRFLPGMIR